MDSDDQIVMPDRPPTAGSNQARKQFGNNFYLQVFVGGMMYCISNYASKMQYRSPSFNSRALL
jgi:hypothetical protein